MTRAKQLQVFAWTLVGATTMLALIAWWQVRLNGQSLTTYDIFPILGLLAFSIMWTHYVAGAARHYLGEDRRVLRGYFRATAGVVLGLILLHPGLLVVQLWRDGLGLPPISYLQVYVENMQQFALLLGSVSLLAFLAFEFHRKFGKKPWWKYVNYANIVAMFAIFYHALVLGGELNLTWFRTLWYFYGMTLIGAIAYTIYKERRAK